MDQPNQNPAGMGQPEQQGKKNVGMAVVAYILFFVPLLTDAKNDPFVKYHIKQGLTLFITAFIVSVISWIPPLRFIYWLLSLGVFILFVIGVLNAVNGREKQMPLIGQFADKFNF